MKDYSDGIKRVWVIILFGALVGLLAYTWILDRAFDRYERTLMATPSGVPLDATQRDAAVRKFAEDSLSRRRGNRSQVESVPTPETLKALDVYLPEDLAKPSRTLANLSRYFRARATGDGQTLGNGPCSQTTLPTSFADADLLADSGQTVEACISALIARYLSAAETAEPLPPDIRAAASTPLTITQFNRASFDFAILGAPARDEAVIIAALHRHFQIPPSEQVQAVLAEALRLANQSPYVERARLGVDLFRGIWQCFLLGILASIIIVIAFVRLSGKVLPGARRRLAWLLDSATAFGLAGTVHGLILALFAIKTAMRDESTVAYASVMGGMALAFSTTLIGVAIERFGRFFANGHDELPE